MSEINEKYLYGSIFNLTIFQYSENILQFKLILCQIDKNKFIFITNNGNRLDERILKGKSGFVDGNDILKYISKVFEKDMKNFEIYKIGNLSEFGLTERV